MSLAADEISSAKQKIIALSPHTVELLYAIGAGDRIIATVEFADYPEDAKSIPIIGNYNGLQIERIVELQPDLIVAWKSGNKSTDLRKIESLGFNIYYSQPQNISEISHEIIELGKLTHLEKNAEALALSLNKKHLIIKQRYTKKSSVKVFYQLWHDPLRSIGPNTWINSLISDCNGHNILADSSTGYPVISIETVIDKNPEVIIIPHHSGTRSEKQSIWKKWSVINAVKNHHISIINGDLLHRLSPRALLGLEQLCQAIDAARANN